MDGDEGHTATGARSAVAAAVGWLDVLAQNCGRGVIVLAGDGTVLACGARAAELLGHRSEDIVGRPLDALAQQGPVTEVLATARAEPVRCVGLQAHGRDGAVRDVSLAAFAVDGTGEPAVGTWLVVGGAASEKADPAGAEAGPPAPSGHVAPTRAAGDLPALASGLAHQIASPLAAISLLAGALGEGRGGHLDERGADCVRGILRSADEIGELVDGIRRYAELVGATTDRALLDSADALQDALDSIGAPGRAPMERLEVGELPEIRADRAQLALVFRSLLDNALKYRAEDRSLEVHIDAIDEGAGWRFRVSDNGIGVRSAHAAHVLEPLYRAPRAAHIPGAGLGLAVCQAIVEGHGGHIWVESAPDVGTTVTFTIPDDQTSC